MRLAKKIANLNTADILTLGIAIGAFGADIFLNSNKVRVGIYGESFGNCPPGQVYDNTTYTCTAAPTQTTTTPTASTAAPASTTTAQAVTTVSTPTTSAVSSSGNLTFSGNITSLGSGNLAFLTGNNDTIYAGGTSGGYGMPYWSGSITYSNGAFNGSWSLNGTPVITGSGNSISGNGITATAANSYASYSGSITYSGGAFNGVIYISVAGSQPVPVIAGSGQNIIGVAGANNTGFAGAVSIAPASSDVAGTLQSVITKLTSMTTQTQNSGSFSSFSTWQNSSSGQHTSAAASVSYSNGAVVMTGAESSNYGGCGGSWNGNAVLQVGASSLSVSTSGMFSSSGSISLDSTGFTGGSISINDTGVPGCARRGISFNISIASSTVLNISVGGATSGGNLAGQVQVPLATQQVQACPSGYTDENGICLS